MHIIAAISRAHRRLRKLPFLCPNNTEHILAQKIEGGSTKHFTTINNLYPKSRPQTLHLLDKFSKIAVTIIPESKVLLFPPEDSNKVKGV